MSFIKRWDVDNIQQQIRACGAQVHSVYNDGFTAWECKKDLLDIKYQVESLLESSPTFAGEEKYHEEKLKEKAWRVLNEKIN